MTRPNKRGREAEARRTMQTGRLRVSRQVQIAMVRLRQGCYAMCAGSFVAIPPALLAEHSPHARLLATIGGMALLTGATGLLLEVVENRVFAGGADGT